MENLTTKEMTIYLEHIVDLESSIYRQTAAQKKANEKLYAWEKPSRPYVEKKEIEQPEDKTKKIVKPREPKYEEDSMGKAVGILLSGLVCLGSGIVGLSLDGGFFFGMFALIGLFMLFGFYGFLVAKKNNATLRENYNASLRQYNEDMEKAKKTYEAEMNVYRKRMDEAEAEYQQTRQRKEEEYQVVLENALQAYDAANEVVHQFDAPLAESKELLERLYNKDVIFPKYRNMIAMCTIYEYFASGRVSTLEGPDGAYNLYESELRQNLIINKLENIVTQLEQIKQNQYMLYHELSKTNEILRGISGDVVHILDTSREIKDATSAIAVSSHITACCSQAIEKNTKALKYIALLN